MLVDQLMNSCFHNNMKIFERICDSTTKNEQNSKQAFRIDSRAAEPLQESMIALRIPKRIWVRVR